MSRSKKQLKSQRKQRKQKSKTQKRQRRYRGGGRLPTIRNEKTYQNPFIMLGIKPRDATNDLDDWRKAYRKRALQFSQDKNPAEKDLANKLMLTINGFHDAINSQNGQKTIDRWLNDSKFIEEANASRAINPVPNLGNFEDQFNPNTNTSNALTSILTQAEQAFVDDENNNNKSSDDINKIIRTIYRDPQSYSEGRPLTQLAIGELKVIMRIANIPNVDTYTSKEDMIRALNDKGIFAKK